MKYKIENLVLEGGGVCGVAFAGAIQELEKLDLISNVKHFAGSSIGVIVIFLLALGLSGDEIEQELKSLNFKKLKTKKFGILSTISNLAVNYGMYDGLGIESWIKNILVNHEYDPNITLLNFNTLTNKILYITTTNVSLGKSIILTHTTHPNLEVWKAIRMSSCFPLIFFPILHEGHKYVDGGLLNNYPIRIFDNMEKGNHTLGLRLDSNAEISNAVRYANDNVVHFIESLCDIVYSSLQNNELSVEDWDRTIRIDTLNISGLNFNITPTTIDTLIESGRSAVHHYLNRSRNGNSEK